MNNTSVLQVLLPTQVVAREMKASTTALSPAALEHLSGALAKPAEVGAQ
jgi:hypothetical protein